MRWKTSITLKSPVHGDRRVVKYYAILPTELDDGYTVWLETYYATEEWVEIEYDYFQSHWKIIKTSVYHTDKSALCSDNNQCDTCGYNKGHCGQC